MMLPGTFLPSVDFHRGAQDYLVGLPDVQSAPDEWRAGWHYARGRDDYWKRLPYNPAEHPGWQDGWQYQAGRFDYYQGRPFNKQKQKAWQTGWYAGQSINKYPGRARCIDFL